MAKFEVDEADLFFLRCAATDYLIDRGTYVSSLSPEIDNSKYLLSAEIYKALQNTKLKDLRAKYKPTN